MFVVLKALFSYVKMYKILLFFYLVLFGLDILFVSLAPLSFNYLLEFAVAPKDVGMFNLIVITVLSLGFVCTLAGVIADRLLARLNAQIEVDLRESIFIKLQRLPIQYFLSRRTGDSSILLSGDVPTISTAMVSLFSTGIQSIVVVIVSMTVLIYLDWIIALLIVAGAICIFVGPVLLSKKTKQVYEQYKQHSAALTSEVTENIKAQKLIKSYNIQHTMLQRFQLRTKQLFVSSYKLNTINAALGRIPMITLLLINVSIMLIGAYLVIIDRITLGELITFYTMYMSMGNSVYSLTFIIPTITDAKVSIQRISTVIDEKDEIEQHTMENNALDTNEPHVDARTVIESDIASHNYIAFNDVSFGYETNRHILKRINLQIPYGSNVALIGSSGSGKSSVVNLILGMFTPQHGDIRVDGKLLYSDHIMNTRDQIAVVFQDNFLFQGTIKENILLGKADSSDEEVYNAAKLAEIHDYIMSLPQGYETLVLDEGSNLSGGQRQRLAIARALIRNPKLLILDEATSALDPATEAAINATVNKLAKDRTIISVTHRLSTISNVDLIAVFNQGELVEQGTHDQLIALGRYYYSLWEKQTGFNYTAEQDDVEIDAMRLSKLNFFNKVPLDMLEQLSYMFNTVRFEKGSLIIREGEPGDTFYIIIRGKVEVTKKWVDEDGHEQTIALAKLEDGDHFGEIALLEHVARTATIQALTDCVMITLRRKSLHYILSKHEHIDDYIRQVLEQRMS